MPKKQKFYREVLFSFAFALRGLFLLLPLQAGLAFGGLIGRNSFRVLAKERRKTLAHLALAFPEKNGKELERIGSDMFEHYGRMVAEWALLDRLIPRFPEMIAFEGREHFDAALKKGKGVIALTAHFGNWELLGGALCLSGYPGSVIARRIYFKKYDEWMVGVRSKMGLETIYRDEPARRVLRALRDNRVLGVVADQDVETVESVFVDFFGRPASTPTAPVRFATATGAALVPCFILREGRRHRIVIEPPLFLSESGDKEKDLLENTQKWVAIQEGFIRRYPHLWVWNHKRWKTRQNSPVLSKI